MREVAVVLVGPKNEGNVGAVARAMKNFGARRLVLVDPCPIGDEARKRAMHATDILDAAEVVGTFEEALNGLDLVAGGSRVSTRGEKKFLRVALSPRGIAAKNAAIYGGLGILFRPDAFGLLAAEIALRGGL